MRISAKGRYALAAIIEVARSSKSQQNISVLNIAQTLGISKIYLEQIFSQLKKGELLTALKGSRGGYQLARTPQNITAWDILACVETALTENPDNTVDKDAPEIELALKTLVFAPLDLAIKEALHKVTLQQMLEHAEEQKYNQAFMINL